MIVFFLLGVGGGGRVNTQICINVVQGVNTVSRVSIIWEVRVSIDLEVSAREWYQCWRGGRCNEVTSLAQEINTVSSVGGVREVIQ